MTDTGWPSVADLNKRWARMPICLTEPDGKWAHIGDPRFEHHANQVVCVSDLPSPIPVGQTTRIVYWKSVDDRRAGPFCEHVGTNTEASPDD